jgi:multimeric flavodoxin WrbA
MQSIKQEKDFRRILNETPTVLGIVGSPRRGCNTETIVDAVLAGATEYGAVSEKFILHDMNIAPCRACDSCQKTGKCIQKDDIDSLIGSMKKSDVWILGTPLYWWGLSAQLKAFIDRWYGLDQRLFQGKRLVLVIPMGGGDKSDAKHITGMMKDICSYLSMELIESIIAPEMDTRTSAREDRHLLEDARAAGIRASQFLRK